MFMPVAEICLHNLRTEPCPAWLFVGEWKQEEIDKADKLFSKYIEYKQIPNFNYWKLLTDGCGWVIAMRFTWDQGCIGGNWEKLEKDLEKYYGD